MHLALILISSILFIIHVQSLPHGCQQGIRSLSAILTEIANNLGDGPLHARVSNLAGKLEKFSIQARNAQNTAASIDSRDKCIREMNSFHTELTKIVQILRSSNGRNQAAVDGLDNAIGRVELMIKKRQTL
ncbi:Globin CTT-VIIB-4 [Dirofilaria immitis]